MKIRESFRSSFKSLLYNKLRSFLTMLGVIIGVLSVILLTSIGEGVKQEITNQVESLGANLLYVLPGNISIGPQEKQESRLGVKNQQFSQAQNVLTYDDVLQLKKKKAISAASGLYNGTDKLNKLNLIVSTTGIDEDYIKVNKMDLKYGRFITEIERKNASLVAVIGDQANKEIFDGQNSIGKSFQLNGKDYKVVGILQYKKKENMGPGADDLNTKIFLPITEMLSRNKSQNIPQIIVQAISAESVSIAETEIKNFLDQKHKDSNFSVIKQQDMLKTINSIVGILTAALGGIAAISLLVGGIGIMNIMLVSVTERTREIGVRKAIGAKRRDILTQFLIESTFLSLTGGLIGMALGIGGAKLLPQLVPSIHTAISISAVIISLLFALFVGVFFGVYPATKAAKLDPIEALRSE